MSINDRPIANPAVVLREEFDNWGILFNPDTGNAVGINSLGTHIWKKLDGRKVDDVIKSINKEFSEVPEGVDQEVTSFIDGLVKCGLAGYELESNE
ncbi:PqqD family peptide modification chaperone [Thermodesulfobacteriota bacterium]